jgi:hypothetical protein
MNYSTPSPIPPFSIPSLIWSGCCLTAGITFLVLSGLDYAKGSRTKRSLNIIQTELSQAVQEHGATLRLLTETIAKQEERAITSNQYIKLGSEIRGINDAYSYQISTWRNLKKDLDETGEKLQQAMAEIQFAKANLESSGMTQENIENLLRQLCEQAEKNLR